MAERNITIKIIGDAASGKKAFQDLGGSADTFSGKIEGAGGKFAGFGTVVGGVVAAGAIQKVGGWLIEGAKGATEDALAMDLLKSAVEKTGVQYDAIAPKIDAAIKRGQDLAFTDGETAGALEILTDGTGSAEEALARLGTVQDFARAKNISLEAAAKLFGKVTDENTTALRKYGLSVEDGATAQDLLNAADEKFGGRAGTFAESDAGKLAKAGQQFGEFQETIGGMLIPVFVLLATTLSTVFTALEPVTAFIGDNIQPIMIGLATAIAVIVIPAFVAWALAAGAAAVATVTAMLPVIAIAAAVGLAVAGLYLIWSTNFLGIRDIVQQVIDFVVPYVETAISTVQTIFETVFPIIQGVVEFYVLAWQTIIVTAFDVIKAVFETVFPIIQTIVETVFPIIWAVVSTYIGLIQAVIETGLAAIQLIWDPLWTGLQVVVDAVMLALKGIVQVGMWAIKDVIGPVLDAIKLLWDPIWNGLKATVDTVLGVAGAAGGVVGSVTTAIGDVYDAISDKLVALRDEVWDPIWNGLKGTVDTVVEAVKTAWNFVAGVVNSALNVWNNLSLSFDTHIPGIGTIKWESPNVPLLPTFDGGGGGGAGEKSAMQVGPGEAGGGGVSGGGGVTVVPAGGNLSGGASLGTGGGGGGRGMGTVIATISAADIARQAAAIKAAVKEGMREALGGPT